VLGNKLVSYRLKTDIVKRTVCGGNSMVQLWTLRDLRGNLGECLRTRRKRRRDIVKKIKIRNRSFTRSLLISPI
jgi:hypothetical protein